MNPATTPKSASSSEPATALGNRVKSSRSIITRLTLMVAGILVVALVFNGSLALLLQRRQLERALETKANSLAQFVAQVSPLSVLSLNFVEMNNNVKKVVLSDDEVIYAVILNDEKIPLAQFFKDTDPLVTKDITALVEQKKPVNAMGRMKQSGRILEVAAPVMAGERHLGSVVMGFSYEPMHRALRNQIAVVGALTVLIIGLSSLLLRWVLRRILAPVKTLTNAATQISTGNLDVKVIGAERTDELGILSRAFGSMTEQLRTVIAGLKQNVTELQRTTEALQESEERFRTAFENANVGVCMVATDGRLLKVNAAMCRMFGYSREELEKMTVETLSAPEEKDPSTIFISEAVAGGTSRASFDKRYVSKGGKTVWGHVSASLVRDTQGKPLYFISHVQDVTERKEAEEMLRRLNQELDERVKERTAALEQSNRELQDMNRVFVHRELRMVELKKQIQTLEARLGRNSNH